AAFIGRLQNLQVAPWQELTRLGDIAGVAAELHAVLGGPERGGTNAFAGRQQRPRQCVIVDTAADRAPEPPTHIAEIALLAALDLFAPATGKNDPVEMAEIDERIGQIKMLDRAR